MSYAEKLEGAIKHTKELLEEAIFLQKHYEERLRNLEAALIGAKQKEVNDEAHN